MKVVEDNNLTYLFKSGITGFFIKFTHHPEPDIKTVGVPPDTFRHLRVGFQP
jgi:hypothetical protein